MDGFREDHTKRRKSDRDMSHHDTACMWNLMKGYKLTYLQNRNGVTNVKNKFVVIKEKGGDKWGDWV